MTAVPRVGVYDFNDASQCTSEVPLPGVFQAPIRNDIVHFVHSNLAKNSRQARGVNPLAGMRHAAISWGPGRAVARVPRVTGSGSQRTGQAAFANMTRKGRMFAPLKTWRRWHRKVNLNQRRYALCSALAATACVPLVQARGHRVSNVPCIPLVVEDSFNDVAKTSTVETFLETFGAMEDVTRCKRSRSVRAGRGKTRNRRYEMNRGPLFVLSDTNVVVARALRNIPGVDVCNVNSLDIRQLAPGAHLGRFVVWTRSAFQALNGIFGTPRMQASERSNFTMQRSCLSNADIQRIINSNEVQSVVRDAQAPSRMHDIQKKNPLRNANAMERLYPGARKQRKARRNEIMKSTQRNAGWKKNNQGMSRRNQDKQSRQARRQASRSWMANVNSKQVQN